jgi:hypothetical protein
MMTRSNTAGKNYGTKGEGGEGEGGGRKREYRQNKEK